MILNGVELTDLATIDDAGDGELTSFSIQDAAIDKMYDDFGGLTIAGPQDRTGYESVHQARMTVKNHRCAVENLRKKLKEEPLRQCRQIDDEARRITQRLIPLEEQLQKKQAAIDAERDRIRREAEDLERRMREEEARKRLQEEENRLRLEREAEEKRLKEQFEARQKEIEAEAARVAEEKRILAERQAEIDRQQAALAEQKRRQDEEDERRYQASLPTDVQTRKASLAPPAPPEPSIRELAESVKPPAGNDHDSKIIIELCDWIDNFAIAINSKAEQIQNMQKRIIVRRVRDVFANMGEELLKSAL